MIAVVYVQPEVYRKELAEKRQSLATALERYSFGERVGRILSRQPNPPRQFVLAELLGAALASTSAVASAVLLLLLGMVGFVAWLAAPYELPLQEVQVIALVLALVTMALVLFIVLRHVHGLAHKLRHGVFHEAVIQEVLPIVDAGSIGYEGAGKQVATRVSFTVGATVWTCTLSDGWARYLLPNFRIFVLIPPGNKSLLVVGAAAPESS
jgi:fumarate reductase subunit D